MKHLDMKLYPCRCCGLATITAEFADLLDVFELELEKRGWGIHVNCGYRCPQHNSEVGGVMNSRHMLGEAIDMCVAHPAGVTPQQLYDFINAALGGTSGEYQGGLGLYKTFVHLDIGHKSRWRG
jgi:uncharacterized protein YcbK (DUF882 family)